MDVHWFKCGQQTTVWCNFLNLNLDTVTEHGVYIIWYMGVSGQYRGRVVYVGQGDVAERIEDHREDEDILAHEESHGPLYVTWAEVPAYQRNGVERYLADTFSPLVGEAHPGDEPIAVNAPW